MRFGLGFNFCNYNDWDRFLALERGEEVGEMATSDSTVLSEQFALADRSEEFGFDTLWAFEQHAAPFLMTPDPTQYLSYFAGRLENIAVGSMITVLPWHNPIRLAEQISMLQHFMGPERTYYLGVGRGLARRNFDAMGVSMDNSRERFTEVYDIVKLALTEEMFSYKGQFFEYENVSVRPRPLDPAVITEAWGSWTSEASIRTMAERGLHPLTTPNKTIESYNTEIKLLDEIRAENGYGPANRPILQVPLLCAESEQEAKEGAEQYIREYVDSILRAYELGTDNFGKGKGYEQYKKGSDFGDGSYQNALETLTTKFLADGIIGTPEQCAEKVVAHHELIEPSELVCVCGTGSIPADKTEKSMRLYAEEVLPRVAHLRSEQPAAAG
jgi:alkanesulfonate monooxygenase SsuD/methylene tetrahydromethanopterin reductase-like flavin-dependent oxidoreductase (luciferase family)